MAGIYPSYLHFEAAPSVAWSIPHALGSTALVPVVYDDGAPSRLVVPDEFELDDANNATARFSPAFAGRAILLEATGPTSHVHTQGAAAASWPIAHGLNTPDLLWAIWRAGAPARLVRPDRFERVDNDNALALFAEPVAGHAVLIHATGSTARAAAFAASNPWTFAHALASLDLVPAIYDAAGVAVDPDAFVLTNTGAASVEWAENVAGRVAAYSTAPIAGDGGSRFARGAMGLLGLRFG